MNSHPCLTLRGKVFRGRKVHGEFDIKVEQVGLAFVSRLSGDDIMFISGTPRNPPGDKACGHGLTHAGSFSLVLLLLVIQILYLRLYVLPPTGGALYLCPLAAA